MDKREILEKIRGLAIPLLAVLFFVCGLIG